jgi:hypothetical protein
VKLINAQNAETAVTLTFAGAKIRFSRWSDRRFGDTVWQMCEQLASFGI